jgi:GrpB-like predicted nucleotidyltransferase (UPF0157 family)
VIEVCDYDPGWAEQFEDLRTAYEAALQRTGVPVVAIEHVGSTAVPGLVAKPVIDVDIIVSAEHVQGASAALAPQPPEPGGWHSTGSARNVRMDLAVNPAQTLATPSGLSAHTVEENGAWS